jgi:hypothetical protein
LEAQTVKHQQQDVEQLLLSVSKKPDKADKKQKVKQEKVESLIKQTLVDLQIQEQQTGPDLASIASPS